MSDRIGDRLTLTFQSLDGARDVEVSGDVVTIEDCLRLIEDAMRGAGFHVPFESLAMRRDGDVS